ncbi:MAG TPA: asparagine synthetase B [Candidatus Limnocylindria bacterium]|nr:asparagine synthetase B [Candidatus Limnocylindria bacterium]
MRRFAHVNPLGRRTIRVGRLGALGLVGGLVTALALAMIAMFAMVIARLLLRGGRTTSSNGGTTAGGSGAAGSTNGAADRESAHRGADSNQARGRSYAEIIEALPIALWIGAGLGACAIGQPAPAEAKLLVAMDESQTDHLKAYGLAYWTLTRGQKADWLLNYRGGSFLLAEDPATEREANVRGVSFERIGGGQEAAIRAEIADNNMEAVVLEKAPRVAVYIPPNTPPWDDAVTLALEYADVPYTKLWDEEVLKGELSKYDWLHLHHEDFTAQHGKFYAAYHSFPWYQEEETVQKAMAKKLGFAKVTHLKAAVAETIKDYVGRGGFMFGMCSATDTYDIALAASGVDIVEAVYDGDPADPLSNRKLDYERTLAFKDFRLELDPYLYKFSDIDVTQEAAARGANSYFGLFDFSAKNDPVPTMLIQNHVNAVPEFLGQTTGFRRPKLRSSAVVLGEVEGTDEVKYLHGQFGRGTFTFLGGHDPEDYQHMVGDPPTDLAKYRHSPGYRLILNNVLFPAAEKKKQRT